MTTYLANALKKHYCRLSNKIVFKNNLSLNKVALQMWEMLDYSEIDSSVLSKVINSQRLLTYKQLQIFCNIMNFPQKQRNALFDALTKDKMKREGLDYKKNKIFYTVQTNIKSDNKGVRIHKTSLKLDNDSRKLFKDISSKIVAKNNETSKIGLSFTEKSYFILVAKGAQKLKSSVEKKFEGYNVSIPSCGFNRTVKGLENNCKCGYHLALYGVIRECISRNTDSKNIIESEIKKWISFFFPREAVIFYIENLSSRGSKMNTLLKKLKNNYNF